MDYYSDLWIGYLTGSCIQNCVDLCVLNCPGCKDKLKSPVLHLHLQYSLLDKLKIYLDEVKGKLLPTIEKMYDAVQHKLPHSSNMNPDKELYCNNARFFLHTTNPEALYYGRYLNEQNDCIINDLVNQKPAKKKKKVLVQPPRPNTLDLSHIFKKS